MAAGAPGFRGAFFHGSASWLSAAADLPAASDLDLMVVFDRPNPPVRLGKFVHRGVLLEVSNLAADQLRSPEAVLANYRLAGSFHVPESVIADPSGELTALHAAVAPGYAKRRWVRRARRRRPEQPRQTSPRARSIGPARRSGHGLAVRNGRDHACAARGRAQNRRCANAISRRENSARGSMACSISMNRCSVSWAARR